MLAQLIGENGQYLDCVVVSRLQVDVAIRAVPLDRLQHQIAAQIPRVQSRQRDTVAIAGQGRNLSVVRLRVEVLIRFLAIWPSLHNTFWVLCKLARQGM